MCGTKGCSVLWTFLYFLSGLALLGMGIWSAVDDQVYEYLVMKNPDLMENKTPWNGTVGGLIAVGAYTFIIGILGMAGSCCDLDEKIKNALIAFAVLASLGVIGTLIYAAIATSHYAKDSKNDHRVNIKEHLFNEFTTDDYELANKFETAWNNIQKYELCCGAESFMDYRNGALWNATMGNSGPFRRPVPWTCCRVKDGIPLDEAYEDTDTANIGQCIIDAQTDGTGATELRTQGCFDIFYDIFQRNQLIHMAMGWTCVFVQIVALIASGCLKKKAMD